MPLRGAIDSVDQTLVTRADGEVCHGSLRYPDGSAQERIWDHLCG